MDIVRRSGVSAPGRMGFTIIELLIVIAIIGILVAFLLPAVNASRESARRLQCQSNLRNLGIATENHVTAKDKYPPAATYREGDNSREFPEPPRHSMITYLLPYFEEAHLYSRIDLRKDWNDDDNVELTKQDLGGILICPSAPGRDDKHVSDYNTAVRVDPTEEQGIGRLIKSGLVKNRSIKDTGPNWGNHKRVWDGILQLDFVSYVPGQKKVDRRTVRPRDVLDGMTKTILMFENAGKPICYENGKLSDCHITRFRWASPTLWMTINDVCGHASMVNCNNNSQPYGFHTGGLNTVRADSSVHFMPESIDPDVLVSLVTLAGRDVTGE